MKNMLGMILMKLLFPLIVSCMIACDAADDGGGAAGPDASLEETFGDNSADADADSDTDSDSDTVVETSCDLVSDVTIDILENEVTLEGRSATKSVQTVLVVSWTQVTAADEVWLRFSFENDGWLESPRKPGDAGAHEALVLVVPGEMDVAIEVVSEASGGRSCARPRAAPREPCRAACRRRPFWGMSPPLRPRERSARGPMGRRQRQLGFRSLEPRARVRPWRQHHARRHLARVVS
jgi:hypothetical protein